MEPFEKHPAHSSLLGLNNVIVKLDNHIDSEENGSIVEGQLGHLRVPPPESLEKCTHSGSRRPLLDGGDETLFIRGCVLTNPKHVPDSLASPEKYSDQFDPSTPSKNFLDLDNVSRFTHRDNTNENDQI